MFIRSQSENGHPDQAACECGEDAAEKFRGALARHAAEQLHEEDGKERLRNMKCADNQSSKGDNECLPQCATSGLSHFAQGV